jgi:hypothetical protein
MKKVILASVLAASAIASGTANAASTAVCAGGSSASSATSNPGAGAATDFVKNAFTAKCSANVHLTAESANATYIRVGSGSVKGGRSFAGSTAGGSVSSASACATGCAATDASAAATSTFAPTAG